MASVGVPFSAGFREVVFVAGAKRDDRRWQIVGRMNLMKARRILQCFASFGRKSALGRIRRGELRYIRGAQSLDCNRAE